MQIFIPYIVKSTIVFGVTVPDQMVHHEHLRTFKRKYAVIMGIVSTVVAIISSIFLVLNISEAVQVIVTLVAIYFVIVASIVLYFMFHAKVIALKRSEAWGTDLRQVRVVDTTVRQREAIVSWTFLLLPMFLTLILMGYTWVNYEQLPEMIPTHWGPSGMADSWTEKTRVTAVATPIIFLMMQWMMMGFADAMKHSGIRVNVNLREQSIERQLEIRKFSSWYFVGLTYGMTLLMAILQLSIIHEDLAKANVLLPSFIGLLVFIIMGTLLYAWKMYKVRLIYPRELTSTVTDVDDDRYWKGGLIYFNPHDPSIFVEKRFGIGWTMNMANVRGYVVFVLPLVLILVFSFLIL